MNSGLLFCLLLAAASTLSHPTEDFGLHLEEEWTNFKETYGRVFARHEDELSRKGIFEDNLKKIRLHNFLYSRGLKSFALGINKFTDMTTEEYQYSMLTFQIPQNASEGGRTFLSPMNVELPKEVDWRTKGLVTPVKDQGFCGSCWAFSTTGSIEGQQARKTGKMVSLSEQNLVDCSRRYGNNGCHGGLMTYAFQYIIDNNGIDTEEGYPYEAVDEGCRFKEDKIGAVLTGYTNIERGDEQQLMEAVATVGPISVAIDAHHFSFKQFHGDGVFEEPNCSSDHLTHAVLVVGYGTQDGKDYWIVKNSWGTGYGSAGYIKMARNQNNMCGIATMASYPNV